uniref:Putative secreted protein n=1 Tax=Ixodes ricinus TaxID=34613 RepID=A0A6B0UKZ3_IXORI
MLLMLSSSVRLALIAIVKGAVGVKRAPACNRRICRGKARLRSGEIDVDRWLLSCSGLAAIRCALRGKPGNGAVSEFALTSPTSSGSRENSLSTGRRGTKLSGSSNGDVWSPA